jgi:hypothetical protein
MKRTSELVRMGAVAAFLLAVAVLAEVGLPLISTEDARANPAAFLDGVTDRRGFALVLGVILLSQVFLIPAVGIGVYHALRTVRPVPMTLAVASLFLAAAPLAVALAMSITQFGYLVPAWNAATDEATRGVLLSNFLVLQWLADVLFVVFNVALAVGIGLTSYVYVVARLGRRWIVTGWIGLATATGLIMAAGFGFVDPNLFALGSVIGVVGGTVWLVLTGTGLWKLASEHQLEPAVGSAPSEDGRPSQE